jgi:hypothetical protein
MCYLQASIENKATSAQIDIFCWIEALLTLHFVEKNYARTKCHVRPLRKSFRGLQFVIKPSITFVLQVFVKKELFLI